MHSTENTYATAEFFAGIGLVRMALENVGFRVTWANDIDPKKHKLYSANFSDDHFVLDDIRHVSGHHIPAVDLAAASFPCTDLSLAGGRSGLDGEQSGMFWEFIRILAEMEDSRPATVVLENVAGFSNSRGGSDLRAAIEALNGLGYWCDILLLDARRFVPQSRPRVFIVGSTCDVVDTDPSVSDARPQWLPSFRLQHPDLDIRTPVLPSLPSEEQSFADVVERLEKTAPEWWDADRTSAFIESLSPLQASRLKALKGARHPVWRTAYRRTRGGRSVWEMRDDCIAGCLRTARGGSSKQAVVEVAGENVRVRWMTPREYARLQGAPNFILDGATRSEAIMGFGDAVCVPVYEWLAKEYLVRLASACEIVNT